MKQMSKPISAMSDLEMLLRHYYCLDWLC